MRRKVLVSLGALVAVAAVAGWHVGTGQAESRQTALTRAHPPALAWLTFLSDESNEVSDGGPHVVLDLNIMNLGSTDLWVSSVLSHTATGTADVRLRPNPTVGATPGETAHRVVDVRGDCTTAYTGASLQIDLLIAQSDGVDRTSAQINTVDDGSIGIPFADVLGLLCQNAGQPLADGGLDGIYVQQTSSAHGAVLVITNHSSSLRTVRFNTAETDGFRLHSEPRGIQVLGAGRSVSVLLTFSVSNCHDVGRLTNYADGVTLQVRRGGQDITTITSMDPTAQLGLRDSLLAPLGAAVAKHCQ